MTSKQNNDSQQPARDYSCIPEELRIRPQWVCYKMEPANDGQGELTKIPREPRTGARAKINDPSTFTTFEEAYKRLKRYHGLEYMLLADDPYFFVDLDHCIDLATGKPLDWAQRIINRFNSYTELSQSGQGIHIIGRGGKPGTKCRTNKRDGIEVYDSARPIVMTGNIVQGQSRIEACGNEINGFYQELFGEEEEQAEQAALRLPTDNTANDAGGCDLSDADLIAKACNSPKSGAAFSLLWNGNTSEYNNDDSAADQALCNHLAFWTNKDPERVDRLFRQSGLMRDKWEKREDYRRRTIDKAIQGCRSGYTHKSHPRRSSRTAAGSGSGLARESAVNGLVDGRIAHLTDLGNAEYLVALHGDDLRYDVDSGRWLHWDGTHWHRDDTGQIERLARDAIRSLYDQLRDEADPDRAKALFGHIKKSESKPRLDAMIALARYCPDVPVKAKDLDANHWLLNTLSGTLDLRTGELRPHDQADLMTKMAPVHYNPDAPCPRWNRFLEEVFQGSQDLARFAQRVVGYCLTGDTREESVFILYGRAQCGKSKFVGAIRHILSDYVTNTPITTFVERNDTNTADLASLVGARMVTASEADGERHTFNEPLLKSVSGRDPITCRFLYRDFFTYVPTYKVIFSTNDIPVIRSQSFAMKRRIKLLPFRQRFYDPEENREPVKDDQLEDKLAREAEGILAWAVRGCLEWQEIGLDVPAQVRDEINSMFETQDPLMEFIEDCCELHPACMVHPITLWTAYREWCELNKMHIAFRQPSSLSRNLLKRDGITSGKSVTRERVLRGIALGDRWTDKGALLKDSHAISSHGQSYRNRSLSVPSVSDPDIDPETGLTEHELPPNEPEDPGIDV